MTMTLITFKEATEILSQAPYNKSIKDLYVVLITYDFGRDANGNTINKYLGKITERVLPECSNSPHRSLLNIIDSPKRREQSYDNGRSTPLWRLSEAGYNLEFVSQTYETGKGKNKDKIVAYKTVYKIL
jgi:hypothetical protein